jgi:hypothetical protein
MPVSPSERAVNVVGELKDSLCSRAAHAMSDGVFSRIGQAGLEWAEQATSSSGNKEPVLAL